MDPPAGGGGPTGVGLIDEARRRLDAGDPRSARTLAEAILAAAREGGHAEHLGPAAQLMGECLYVMGEVQAAWPLAEEALGVDEARGDDVAVASDLNLLGVLQLTVGRLPEAVESLGRSHQLRAAALGADHEDAIESQNNLAVAIWRSGDKDGALRLHEDALQRCERALGEGHRRTATTLNALAVKVATLDDGAARARALYERGLAAAELALGPDGELVARLLTNVASARLNDGVLAGTGLLLERALELHERHFGPTSRWTAHVLHVQGTLASQEARHADARRAFERAFVIRVKELGPTDTTTIASAFGLASALSELSAGGDEEMAEATAIFMPLFALRPQHAPAFFRGASTDEAAASAQLREIARRIEERSSPDPHRAAARERARALMDEADATLLDGDPLAAADRLREAIGLLEAAFGGESTLLVEPLYRLRHHLRMAGIEGEVLPTLERIAAILATAYGAGHPLALRALAEQYWQERREYGPGGGGATARRIEELAGRTLGEQHPLAQLVRNVMGAARQESAHALPDSEPLSTRRERYLATTDPLRDELLGDLGATAWSTLDHAYGPAIDTPRHLAALLSNDERLRADGLQLLGESLLHGGVAYPATAPAMRFIRRLAAEPRVQNRPHLLELLFAAHHAAGAAPAADEREAERDLSAFLARIAATDPDPQVVAAAAGLLERTGPDAEQN